MPAAILLVSVILAAIFYRLLPEQVAYHFSDGQPDRWLGRTVFTTWTLVGQAVLTLGSLVFVRLVLLGTRYMTVENAALQRLLPVMGNMVALPQIIILFAILDVFLYNLYQIKLIPLLIFALIVLVLGGAALGVFFFRAARQASVLYQ